MFLLADGTVSWLSKQQGVVVLSTSEAKYVALSRAAQEAAWLQKLLTDLQIPTKLIVIKEDDQGAIALARNPIVHSRTKHIDIRFYFIRKAQEGGIINIVSCPISEMVADLLTKPIPCGQFEKLRTLMGMKNLSTNFTN